MNPALRSLLLTLAVALAATAVLSLGFLDLGREPPRRFSPEPGTFTGIGPQSTPSSPAPPVNLITYVSGDGQIHTIAPDGSDERRISPESLLEDPEVAQPISFTWPTWSPDGRRLAFSGITGSGSGERTHLMVAGLGEGTADLAYSSPLGVYPYISGRVPHYIQWASDSQQVAFLAMGQQGLSLLVAEPPYTQEAQLVALGAQLYLAWAPLSRQLLLHVEESHFLVATDGSGVSVTLVGDSVSYRTPAWAPDERYVAYMGPQDEEESILLVSADGARTRLFNARGEVQVFLWSPRGDLMAIAYSSDESAVPFFEGLRLLRTDRATLHGPIYVDEVIAFFWSPDGTKLGVASFDTSQRAILWTVVDVDSGESRAVGSINPSQDLLFMLSYFDQYALSHSVWSPDSRYLVVTGTLAQEANDPGEATPQAISQVIVLDTDGEHEPLAIATGPLAFWSPR